MTLFARITLVGAVLLAVGAAAWFVLDRPGAPPVPGPGLKLRWRAGTTQQYRLDLDARVHLGGDSIAATEPIHQEVRGVLAFETLEVGPDVATVGLRLDPVELRVGGVADAEATRALAAPFRVDFARNGLPARFAFAPEVSATHRDLLEELVRTFQVELHEAETWCTAEAHATGRYEANYARDGSRVHRTKIRYLAPAAGSDAPQVDVRAAAAEVWFDVGADWLGSMVVDETLVARDRTGVTFQVTTHATLALLAAPAVASPEAVAWSFAAADPAAGDGSAAGRGAMPLDRTSEELAAELAELIANLDAAAEGRSVWVHRLRDLLRADARFAPLLVDTLQQARCTDRTRADVFLALELAATSEAQTALVRVGASSEWAHRDRTRALIALGGTVEPTEASLTALWAASRERASPEQADVANTALLALGSLGSRMPHASAAYASVRAGLLGEAWGAAGAGERAIVILALSNTGDRQLGAELAPFLDDPSPDVRRAAAKAVGRLDDDAPITFALRLPHESSSAVRATMAAALAADARPPEVMELVRERVTTEPDEITRLELARCLGRDLDAHPENERVLRELFAAETSDRIRRLVGEVLGRADAKAAGSVPAPERLH